MSSGLFKQIHGVNFVWHDITLPLPAGTDVFAAKKKLLDAVTDALKDYREEILRQSQEIQRAASTNLGTASATPGSTQPRVQLKFSAAGVEAQVHYPVHLQHAAEIDERVSQELSNVVAGLTPRMPAAQAG